MIFDVEFSVKKFSDLDGKKRTDFNKYSPTTKLQKVRTEPLTIRVVVVVSV